MSTSYLSGQLMQIYRPNNVNIDSTLCTDKDIANKDFKTVVRDEIPRFA